MEPPTFEEVCAMDYQPRRSNPGVRISGGGFKTRSLGRESMQSMKTTAEHRTLRQSRDTDGLLSSRRPVQSSMRGSTADAAQFDDLRSTLQAANPHLRQTALVLRNAVAESDFQKKDAYNVLNSVLDDSISALQEMEARYRKTLEQKHVARISKKSLDLERSQSTEVTRLSQEVQSLRAESRHLSILEGELKLARSARPWLSQIPTGVFACEQCIVRVKSAALCRIVYGHTLGLIGEHAAVITKLHSSYKQTPGILALKDPDPPFKHHPDVQQMINKVSMLQKPIPKEELMVPDLPWLRTVAPFMRKEGDEGVVDPEILRRAPATLDLDYVYSYTGEHGHRNILSLTSGELLYSAGAVCVVLDAESRQQRLFRGHTDLVLSIALFPLQSGGLVASGQIGDNPMVFLWSTHTMQQLVCLKGNSPLDLKPLMLPQSVVALSFSPDGRTLVAVGGDDEHTIVVHRNESKGDLVFSWESSTVVDVQQAGHERIICAEFSPFGPLLVTCGVKHMKFWELNEKDQLVGTDGMMGCESQEETFLCLAFLDAETSITGLESGMIWIWKGLRVMKTIWRAHQGPVFDIAIDGFTAITGGEDMKLCLWNFAKDYRLVPPGEFTRGEMLVKEIEVAKAVCQTPGSPPWLEQLGFGPIRSLSWKGHRVAVGTARNQLLLIDDNAGTGQLLVAGHYRGGLTGVAMHPRLPWMFTAGGDGTVLVWNLVTRRVETARNYEMHRAFRKKTEAERMREVERGEDEEGGEAAWLKKRKKDWQVGMTCIDVSADGTHIAVGQDDGGFFIQKLEYEEGKLLVLEDLFAVMPEAPQRAVSKIRFSPDLGVVAVAQETGVVRLYRLSELVAPDAKHTTCRALHSSVRQMDWDEAGVVIRCNDDHFQLSYIDSRDGLLLKGRGPVRATRGGDREVQNSKWASVTCPLSWQAHGLYLGEHNSGDVNTVARSPSKQLLAAGDVYGKVVLCRNPCLSEEAGLEQQGGHGEEVCFVGFTRHSDMVVSGGRKGASIFQWRVVPEESRSASVRTTPQKAQATVEIKSEHTDSPERGKKRAPPLQVVGASPPAWSSEFGWAEDVVELRQIIDREPHTAHVEPRATLQPFLEPWRLNSLPPKGMEDRDDPDTGEGCDFEAELDGVVGYSGAEHRGNVVCLLSGETVYPAGAICVLASADGEQRFFRGHLEAVTAVAVHPNGGMVASGDAGDEASVLVWDSGGGRWTGRTLWVADAYLRRVQKKGIVSLSFSGDGTHLLSLGGDAEHTLMIHRWEEETPLLVSKISGGDKPVLAARFNPYSSEIVSCGVGHVSFWSFTAKGLHALDSGVGDEFFDWAVSHEACCSTQQEAVELGSALLQRTCISAAFLDEVTAVTGSVDGRIYLWKKQRLQSAEKGHDGAVFDLDSSRGRGLFRGTLLITMEGARKDVISLLSQGARSEEERQVLADTAMQRWYDDVTYDIGRPPSVKSAVVSWSAAENGGMASCGGREVKVWGWELELCVGFHGFGLGDSFERFSTVGRGRHKWRPRSMTIDEFFAFLRSVQLLFDPNLPHDTAARLRAVDEREGRTHPMVTSVEAARVFASAEMEEIGMEEFVQMVGQVVGLVVAKERGDTPHCHRREKLEMDMVDLQGHLSDLERRAMEGHEDYSHRILQVREEVKGVAVQLKAMRVFVRRILRVTEQFEVGRDIVGEGVKGSSSGSAVALFHCHDRRIVVGTASDEVFEIQMETGGSTLLASGQGGVPIAAICAVNETLIALSEATGTLVHVWDMEAGKTVTCGRFRSLVASMDALQASNVLAVGLADGSLHIVEIVDGLPALCALRIGKSSAGAVTCVRFSPDGGVIAAGMEDATLLLLSVDRDERTQEEFSVLRRVALCQGHDGMVTGMDWSEDGMYLRSESRTGRDLRFWHSGDGTSVAAHLTASVAWQSSNCSFAWAVKPLHRHVAAANPTMNSTVAPVVGHRVRKCTNNVTAGKSWAADPNNNSSRSVGRVLEVAEGGYCMVSWEDGQIGVADGKCELVYDGEELVAVDGSGSLLVGCGSAGSLMLMECKEKHSVFHCSAHSGPVRGVSFLRGGATIVSAGARDRTLMRWICNRRHRKTQGLYIDLERVLRVGATTSFSALLLALEDFANRYFAIDGSPPPSAETKSLHFRLVRLFRVICGARQPLHKLVRIEPRQPSPPPPKFVGRSPIKRVFHNFAKPKLGSATPKPATPKPAWAKKATPRAQETLSSNSGKTVHAEAGAPTKRAEQLDRETRFARFRDSAFSPVGHGRKEGKPRIWHLLLGPLHIEGGVLKPSEAKAIFAALDRGGTGVLSHSDFINGLRKFPRFASRLGLPTSIRQGDGSMAVYLRTFSEIDTNASKTIELEEFLTFFCKGKEDEIVKAKVYQIENRPWSYSSDVVSIPRTSAQSMMITGREPRRRRTRQRVLGAAMAPGPVSLSDADMQNLLGMLGFNRSGPVTYQAFISAVLASPKATALLRAKGVRPEQCAALYCFRFKQGEEWVKWRPEELQVALYRPSWELAWIHRRMLPAKEAWLLFKRLDPSHAGLKFQSLPAGQRAAITFEAFFSALLAFPDIAEAISLDKVLLLDRREAELRTFRLLFGENQVLVDNGREIHLESFVSLFSEEALPPPEGTLLLPSLDNLEHSRRFNLTQREARNMFRQLAACKSAAQDRSVLRHADFLNGLRTFPKIATQLGLPERIGPSGGGLARYQMLVADIFQNKRTITEDDFARYFNPRGREQAWKQQVVVRMITDGEEDEVKTPPPSPKKREQANAHVGTQEYAEDPDVFPEKANLELKPSSSRSIENMAVVSVSAQNAVAAALEVLDVVRSPLVDMDADMERRMAMTLSRLGMLCICPIPLRLSDVELVGKIAASSVHQK